MPAGFELVLHEAGPLEDGGVNGLEDDVVLGAGEVEEAEAVDVPLVCGWERDLQRWGVSVEGMGSEAA